MKTTISGALAVLTTWPTARSRQTGISYSAIGWHAQNTIPELQKQVPVMVFAEKIKIESSRLRVKYSKFRIIRTWQKGNPLSLLSTLWRIAKNKDITNILVQFEFNVFGGTLANIFLLLGLLLVRLTGKKIIFETHQVVSDFSNISSHLGITSLFKIKILGYLLGVYYFILGKISHEIIVFEEILKVALSKQIAPKKIHTLALPVLATKRNLQKKSTKKIKVLVFGYLNWYKGIDIICESFSKYSHLFPHLELILAGGENPYHKGKKYYDEYTQKIKNNVENQENIKAIGFVKDSQVEKTFAESDLVVFPYRTLFSASGPLSLAIRYQKPVVFSSALMGYMRSPDIRCSMNEANLSTQELFFDLDPKKMMQFLGKVTKSKKIFSKLHAFTPLLTNYRTSKIYAHKVTSLMSPIVQKVPNIRFATN